MKYQVEWYQFEPYQFEPYKIEPYNIMSDYNKEFEIVQLQHDYYQRIADQQRYYHQEIANLRLDFSLKLAEINKPGLT